MAAAARHLSRSLFRVGWMTPAKRKCNAPLSHFSRSQCRTFSTTNPRLAEDDDAYDRTPPSEDGGAFSNRFRKEITISDMDPEQRADFEQLSKEDQAAQLANINALREQLASPEVQAQIDAEVDIAARELERQAPRKFVVNTKRPPAKVGFWADDEEDEFAQQEDDDDDVSDEDLTSIALGELELHREMREYARIVAWDMPLLTSTFWDYLCFSFLQFFQSLECNILPFFFFFFFSITEPPTGYNPF